MIFKLAWRNIWRNKRRTFITAAMIVMAVMLSIVMQSVQRGVYDKNIENLVNFTTGFIQINAIGHQEDMSLETSVEVSDELIEKISKTEGVSKVFPKIQTGGLLANDSNSKPVIILGFDTKLEKDQTDLPKKVIAGSYFSENSNGILVSSGLASLMNIYPGDSLIILSQGYEESSANGIFKVEGIVELGSPELNKRTVYMTLQTAQELFYLDGMATNLAIKLDNNRNFQSVADELTSTLDTAEYEVKTWKQLTPELAQLVDGDKASGMLVMMVLYLIISFGVFGTILMMLAERKREFGVVTSIGMKRSRLALVVVLENFIISIMGAFIGSVIAWPIIAVLKAKPISLAGDMKEAYEKLGFEPVITADFYTDAFINNASQVFIIAILLSIYPLIKIMKIKPIEYLRA
ncbi:MAG: ABC transporter permease [Flavobacteriales bacterium]|nr:ABC transporter permease [Flavobacteriales bacterium]